MATAGSIDIPEGELIFDQRNVRTTRDGPHRSSVCSGVLQLRLTPIGYVVCWRPQDEPSVPFNGDMSSSGDALQVQPRRANTFWFELNELKSYHRCSKKDHFELTFMLCDGTRHPTLMFDFGKQNTFLQLLESKIRTRVSPKDKKLHLVVHDDPDALQKSFSSLDLFQSEDTTLVNRFVRDPFPTVADGLAKVANFFSQGAPQRSRQISDGMLELNPASFGEFEDVFTINVDQEPGFDFVEQVPELPPPMPVTRSLPLGFDEWLTFFDIEGRITDPHNLRARIFRGGCTPDVRPEAWKFLLGVYDFSKTAKEREADHSRLTEDYYRMKLQWKSFSADQERRFTAFLARKSLVEKDVNRTDRSLDIFAGDGNEHLSMLNDVLMTYIMYDFDLGYVQGELRLLRHE